VKHRAKQLIVNADDFGLTEGVSRGILQAHRTGIVTSTTLLANGAAFLAAVNLGREAPELGIGVHLNLSEGIPVCPAGEIPTLVDAQGRLHLTPGRLRRAMLLGRAHRSDIETELRAQIAKVVKEGITPTHLDGHMHVHVLPGVSEIVIKLAQEFHIPAVRCPAEKLTSLLRRVPSELNARAGAGSVDKPSLMNRRLIAMAVSWSAGRLRKLLAKADLAYPERFYGIVETGFLNSRVLEQILRALPECTSELMCHPGCLDADLKQVGGRLQEQRETELAAVGFPTASRVAAEQGIRLITYRDLAK
jgi:chitin disaccharide deacetylase